MRVVFFGTSEFAKVVLQEIMKEKIVPLLVVTQPQRPKGRGWKLSSCEVKEFAEKNSLNCIAPEKLGEKHLIEKLEGVSAEFFLVVSYGKLIPGQILSLPKIMPLGLHPSLLPRYRGPAPIRWTLLKGERETGVTLFKLETKFDCGPIIWQKKIPIEERDDYFTLSSKLARLGAQCIVEGIERIRSKNYSLSFQDEKLASFAPKFKKEDGRINWEKSAFEIRNLVRAFKGWPFAYTFYKGKLIRILEVEVEEGNTSYEPSYVVRINKKGIYLSCGDGIVRIVRLKPEGKKEMDAYSFVCGYKIKVGEKFS